MTTRAVLSGPDHTRLGVVADASPTPDVGIALSAGAMPKPYAPVDLNEDAALAVVGDGWLVAVVDGHGGFEAAGAALQALAAAGDALVATAERDLPEAVAVALDRARDAVGEALPGVPVERSVSRTALSVAVGRGRAVAVATLGDTAVLRTGGNRRHKRLGKPGPFLGPWSEPPKPRLVRLRTGERIIVCTDGLIDAFGAGWAAAAARLSAGLPGPQAASQLVEAVLGHGATDNVAVAVGPAV